MQYNINLYILELSLFKYVNRSVFSGYNFIYSIYLSISKYIPGDEQHLLYLIIITYVSFSFKLFIDNVSIELLCHSICRLPNTYQLSKKNLIIDT